MSTRLYNDEQQAFDRAQITKTRALVDSIKLTLPFDCLNSERELLSSVILSIFKTLQTGDDGISFT